jgi:hypothetical protein
LAAEVMAKLTTTQKACGWCVWILACALLAAYLGFNILAGVFVITAAVNLGFILGVHIGCSVTLEAVQKNGRLKERR